MTPPLIPPANRCPSTRREIRTNKPAVQATLQPNNKNPPGAPPQLKLWPSITRAKTHHCRSQRAPVDPSKNLARPANSQSQPASAATSTSSIQNPSRSTYNAPRAQPDPKPRHHQFSHAALVEARTRVPYVTKEEIQNHAATNHTPLRNP